MITQNTLTHYDALYSFTCTVLRFIAKVIK